MFYIKFPIREKVWNLFAVFEFCYCICDVFRDVFLRVWVDVDDKCMF